ncbi:MAG: glutathione S-transferase family protein [Acidobacteriota bacterium]
MKLFIANKNYSSWSLRVWLALRVKGIPFSEDLRAFDVENEYADFLEFSPTGKVPVLVDQGRTLWESLAILEYVAETRPQAGLWPEDEATRAEARCAAHEMHAGFLPLRAACPVNLRRRVEALPVDAAVQKDVRRIETLWEGCLESYGGPFLFGSDFTIADAMYAPVVNRLKVYELSRTQAVRDYSATITSLDAWQEWEAAARAEPWTVDIDEVYA